MISTRGRYALRVLTDLAMHQSGAFIPMKEVAARQEISLKYLERILPLLTEGGFLEGQHGKGGGYRLARAPEDCRVGDVLRLTEGTLAPIACLTKGAPPCARAAECRTLSMWQTFHEMTERYFDGVTIADLAREDAADQYVI